MASDDDGVKAEAKQLVVGKEKQLAVVKAGAVGMDETDDSGKVAVK